MLNKKEDLELERFTKNKKRKFILIGLILGISVTIGGIFLYKSYAYYENEKEYNVIKGIIPDFSYDVKFAINVDGEKKDNIPESAIGKENKYYEVTASCDDGITAEWDYNAWNLKVDNITKGTKCTLAFNSTLSETDYQKYIEAGVAYRRNTYRGKDITSKLENGTLFSEIKSGHFDDIFVGDYIKTTNSGHSATWLVADIDNYLNVGNLTKHHATIIPAAPLMTGVPMNTSITTAGGYMGSKMYKETLSSVLSTYITPVFNSHIISYENFLSSNVTDGKSDRRERVTERKLDLMGEINVYGTVMTASNFWDAGVDTQQYAIFRLNPKFINSDGEKAIDYWLKDVANASTFTNVTGYGVLVGQTGSSGPSGVRPRFLID